MKEESILAVKFIHNLIANIVKLNFTSLSLRGVNGNEDQFKKIQMSPGKSRGGTGIKRSREKGC